MTLIFEAQKERCSLFLGWSVGNGIEYGGSGGKEQDEEDLSDSIVCQVSIRRFKEESVTNLKIKQMKIWKE